jgi:hypothetical protein
MEQARSHRPRAPRGSRRWALVTLAVAAVGLVPIGRFARSAFGRAGQDAITVSGCVERDAATRTPVYKLVARTGGGTAVYRLTSGADVDLASALGHTVEVTGTVSGGDRPREERVITVQKLRSISDRCS